MLVVETIELAKRYGDFQALRSCTLSVREGEVFGLLGPNGAGKSTFLRMLLGFIRPTGGTAKILGLDCVAQSLAVRRKLSYLPGDARLYRSMRGKECLKFFAGMRSEGDYPRALRTADRLDLDLSRLVGFMSTGMRQKLALTIALSMNVPLIMLDEPTANLDPNVRGEMLDIVREAKQTGTTVVFSSHVMSEVEEACDRAAILRAGEIVHVQSMPELASRHRIRLSVAGPPPSIPQEFDPISLPAEGPRGLAFETGVELKRILPWLATLSPDDVRVEPVGLQTVYERFHQRKNVASGTDALAGSPEAGDVAKSEAS
ncbi:MAG TPA: ABC transporter ATP-binding protein [Pirellulaceae bacterium]|nr:ABC transporter ATP-binding protein [Pirellulaceae bacterium]